MYARRFSRYAMSSSTAAGFLTHSNAPFRSSIAAFTFPSHNCPSSSFSNARRRSLGPPAELIDSEHRFRRCHQHKIIAWREIPRLSNQARIHAAPSPRTSNRRSPLRTPNWSNSADTCNHRPSAVASANAYRNPATSTTAVNVHTSLRPVDGWALVLTSSGSTITNPSSTAWGLSLATGNAGSHPGSPLLSTRAGLLPSRPAAGRHRLTLSGRRGRQQLGRARPTGPRTLRPGPRGLAHVARGPVARPPDARCR